MLQLKEGERKKKKKEGEEKKNNLRLREVRQ